MGAQADDAVWLQTLPEIADWRVNVKSEEGGLNVVLPALRRVAYGRSPGSRSSGTRCPRAARGLISRLGLQRDPAGRDGAPGQLPAQAGSGRVSKVGPPPQWARGRGRPSGLGRLPGNRRGLLLALGLGRPGAVLLFAPGRRPRPLRLAGAAGRESRGGSLVAQPHARGK
jgi:hypothetical protein